MPDVQPDIFTNTLITSVGEDVAMEVLKEFHAGHVVKQTLAKARQEAIGAATSRIEHVASEALGVHVAEIDAMAYHYWGQRLGYQCWKDKQFRQEYLRDNPGARVKTTFRTRGKGFKPHILTA
jgi:hypothetical protein